MKIPNRALNQYDLDLYVKKLKIPHFRGIFMRDDLPKKSLKTECGILNLDSVEGPGTHWTCWFKIEDICYYFDSFGLNCPEEFDEYVKCDILYSTNKIQKMNEVICGHLCLYVLYGLMNKLDFHEIVLYLKYNKNIVKFTL